MGDSHRLRHYIEEYTAQNYDRMFGEMAGQVPGAEAVRSRHEANRAGIPGSPAGRVADGLTGGNLGKHVTDTLTFMDGNGRLSCFLSHYDQIVRAVNDAVDIATAIWPPW
jgi:hypothetical protein